jgi:hypothetical protein
MVGEITERVLSVQVFTTKVQGLGTLALLDNGNGFAFCSALSIVEWCRETNVALEDTLTSWASAPSQTELTKCDNAVSAVRKAIDSSAALNKRKIKVFAQGSYCNRTNVRQDSDVDVCVLCRDSLMCDYPTGMSGSDFGLRQPANYSYDTFKDDVGNALTAYFKNGHVTRGNKAFDIKENTYRIAADAVPCFEHRRYHKNGTWDEGTAFNPDNAWRIVNWPEQNYDNGVTKNKDTGGRFKDVVRILKRLRYKMCDEKIAAADPISSFLVECLVWNAPNPAFEHETYSSTVREVLAHLFNDTIKIDTCEGWGEVNELKYIFKGSPTSKLTEAHAFISAAWDYWGYQ